MSGPRSAGVADAPAFDLFGDLPQGTTVLEASAGTGKTFTIAALVTRYVAEGVTRLDDMLVVTFGRAATQELRDRVRERLVTARDGLADAPAARGSADELLRHLATAQDGVVAQRHQRLVEALSSFDAATVVTTHQFCQRVLIGLGTAGDVDAGATLVDNLDDLVNEVVQDLYLRKWGQPGSSAPVPPMKLAEAQRLAREVVRDGQATLLPEPSGDAADSSEADIRARFAGKVREEVDRRKRMRRILGFDDLLTRLQHTLADPTTGPAAAGRLRDRYRVVLVDEFQDTDPVQWDVLRLAFHGAATLVLIGDPKQAIYAFRGADVRAYLAAGEIADHRATLARNWRSDPDLLRGLDALFRGAALGDPRIVVAPVTAAYQGRSLSGSVLGAEDTAAAATVGAGSPVRPVGADSGGDAIIEAPVRLRLVRTGERDTLSAGVARDLVTADVVREVVTTLDSGALLHPRDATPPRTVRPGDIAVIVRTNEQLALVHEALLAAGVPSVPRTTSSVFRTPAGADWIVLLEALEQPHRSGRLRRLAVSSFVGWTASELAGESSDGWNSDGPGSGSTDSGNTGSGSTGSANTGSGGTSSARTGIEQRRSDQDDLDRLGMRLRQWLRMYDGRGVSALFETVSRDERLASRLLGQLGGERRLTDLRHIGEALHAQVMAGQLGLTAVLEWLRRRVEGAGDDISVERSRRLDSDAAAVQVATVWASKGLEFPIVHVPFGWDRFLSDVTIPLFHENGTGRRVRTVGGPTTAGFRDDARRHTSEELGEDLRVLYVALTRAQSQLTVWWAPTKRSTTSAPLHRLLLRDAATADVPEAVAVPGDTQALAAASARSVEGCLSVAVVPDPGGPLAWQRPAEARTPLAAAVLGRTFDTSWRRTSYSALTAGVHDGPPGNGAAISSEPEAQEKDDEPATPTAPASAAALRDVGSPMAALPGGTGFGTLVHAVLERVDPTVDDLAGEVRAQASTQLARFGPAGLDPAELSEALLPALRTPLGALAGGRALADIPLGDRLVELDFELPLRGGDQPNGPAHLAQLGALLRAHLPADDPMAAYAEELDDPVLGAAPLRGYLGGSIDAVLRVDGRYLVVDYKTNRLGTPDEPLTAWDYRRDAIAEAMLHAHYPLQALLYDVALHRFLRWRLAGYEPERHLGGTLYLFLRGMCGPDLVFDDATIPGVFAWRPPAALVVALSDTLAGGR